MTDTNVPAPPPKDRHDALAVCGKAQRAFQKHTTKPSVLLGVSTVAVSYREGSGIYDNGVYREGSGIYDNGFRPFPGHVCDVGIRLSVLGQPTAKMVAGWATHVFAINELATSCLSLEAAGALTAAAAVGRAALEMSARLIDCRRQLDAGADLEQSAAWLYEELTADFSQDPDSTFGSYSDACQAVVDAAATELSWTFNKSLYGQLCAVTHPHSYLPLTDETTESLRVTVIESAAAALAAATNCHPVFSGYLHSRHSPDSKPLPRGAVYVVARPTGQHLDSVAQPETEIPPYEAQRAGLVLDTESGNSPVLEPGFAALARTGVHADPVLGTAVQVWAELAGHATSMFRQERITTGAVLVRFAWEHAMAATRLNTHLRDGDGRPTSEFWTDSQQKKTRIKREPSPYLKVMLGEVEHGPFPALPSGSVAVELARNMFRALNEFTHPAWLARAAYTAPFTGESDGRGGLRRYHDIVATVTVDGEQSRVALAEPGSRKPNAKAVLRIPGVPVTIPILESGQQSEVVAPDFAHHPESPFAATSLPVVSLVLLMGYAAHLFPPVP